MIMRNVIIDHFKAGNKAKTQGWIAALSGVIVTGWFSSIARSRARTA
jgi:hypothetical protein